MRMFENSREKKWLEVSTMFAGLGQDLSRKTFFARFFEKGKTEKSEKKEPDFPYQVKPKGPNVMGYL